MPNWVRNNVCVRRVDDRDIDVKEFLDKIDGNANEDYTLNDIVKEPDYPFFEEEEEGKEYILSNMRYNWRISTWGVKWNTVIIPNGMLSGIESVNNVLVSFDTAWSAPMPALITLSEKLGEDYDISLQATDEFLGNHCDYNLVINDGDVDEIPIDGDYEEWWYNVWEYAQDDVVDVTQEF